MDSPRLSRDPARLSDRGATRLGRSVAVPSRRRRQGDLSGRFSSVTAFMVVHLGMLIFIPLMAAAIWLLLRGVDGTAATVSRIALAPFVIFYSAWETLQGIGVGILASEVNGLPAAERATGADLVQNFAENPLSVSLGVFATIGSLSLILATIAAGVALRRWGRRPRWPYRPCSACPPCSSPPTRLLPDQPVWCCSWPRSCCTRAARRRHERRRRWLSPVRDVG